MTLLKVRHNIEVAHRLYSTPGKCEAIHGHSMWVTLVLEGMINPKTGMAATPASDDGLGITHLEDIEFGAVKKEFRNHLDQWYDHRLLLNAADPFARPIIYYSSHYGEVIQDSGEVQHLPGLQAMPGDPTTENIAMWIYEWAQKTEMPVKEVEVWETSVNCAIYTGG